MTGVLTPQPCFICRRRDDGSALAKGKELRWWCEGCGLELAKKANAMPHKEFDAVEQAAMEEAGAIGGEYLDRIGKTDLATLEEGEWKTFIVKVIGGFGDAMRREITAHTAPF